LGFTFSHEVVSSSGKTITVPLSPKVAGDTPVTDSNKLEYIELVAKARLISSTRVEVECLREGLYEVIPEQLLRPFNPDELALLLCGVRSIDVDDWEMHTHYSGGYTAESEVVRWFWELVRTFTADEKSLLLLFSTGLSTLPVEGFANLAGLGRARDFNITCGLDNSLLPTASTCFNLLKLPNYTSKKDLRAKLFIALRHGSQGFTYS
jgi:hypothetical protein